MLLLLFATSVLGNLGGVGWIHLLEMPVGGDLVKALEERCVLGSRSFRSV